MAIYHLSVRPGTRAKGSVAARKSDYIQRENQYERQPDRCLYQESGNMPEWADSARDYWKAADDNERANGRLYLEVEVALPRELEQQEQIELAKEFAREVTEENTLPYTLAVHEGRGRDGRGDNPHAHLMISERQNDGLERDEERWFKRANSQEPELGGAPKSREFHGSQKIEHLRERWADDLNGALERHHEREYERAHEQGYERTRDHGQDHTHAHDRGDTQEREPGYVDHRSNERQGIERAPGIHLGPGVYAALEKGREPERYLRHQEIQHEIRQADREVEHGREFTRDHQERLEERQLDRGRDRGMGY